MTTSPSPGGIDEPAEQSRHGFRDAVVEREHVLTTHFAVIEGWLGLLEDTTLDDAQHRRAACVVRERTEELRLDLGALLRMVKEWPTPDKTSSPR